MTEPLNLDIATLAALLAIKGERSWSFDRHDPEDRAAWDVCIKRMVDSGLLIEEREPGCLPKVSVTNLGVRETRAYLKANPEEFSRRLEIHYQDEASKEDQSGPPFRA